MSETPDKSQANILIVDDDAQIASTLQMAVNSWEYDAFKAGSIAEAKDFLEKEAAQIVLLDVDLPDGSGLDFLTEIKDDHPETIVVIITGNVDVKNTVAALRGGAYDFIGKPIHLEELRVTLRNSVETRKLRREVKQIRRSRAEKFSFDQIIGNSGPMTKAVETARKVAASDVASILLQGETGTGKDLFARAIHFSSERRALTLSGDQLRGASGKFDRIRTLSDMKREPSPMQRSARKGLFEQADGGTLFLDEIGEMDVSLQAKLLRVLEEGKFRRIGGLKEIPLDLRVIAASNRDLKKESAEGNFRLDLYYRLSIIQIDIPPLRERSDDILLLADHYIDKTNLKRKGEKKLKGLAKSTEKIFQEL